MSDPLVPNRGSLCALLLMALTVLASCRDDDVYLDEAATHFVQAEQAIKNGDSAKAMQELSASIEAGPDPWAYYQRAKLHSDAGDEAAARADCEAGLELDPGNSDLTWLLEELKKPKSRRFKGKNEQPPRSSK